MGLRDRLGGLVGGSGSSAEIELSGEDGSLGKQADVVYEGESYWSMAVDHAPDGEYVAVYYEGEPVFVFRGRELAHVHEVDSANDAAVADDGSVAVVDWLPDREFGGKLYVFDGEGDDRIADVFDANLGPVAITGDGNYVATSTFAPDCRTYVYDVVLRKRVLAHENRLGTKQDLAFDEIGGAVVLHLANAPDEPPLYTIDLDGAIVGRSRRYAELLDRRES